MSEGAQGAAAQKRQAEGARVSFMSLASNILGEQAEGKTPENVWPTLKNAAGGLVTAFNNAQGKLKVHLEDMKAREGAGGGPHTALLAAMNRSDFEHTGTFQGVDTNTQSALANLAGLQGPAQQAAKILEDADAAYQKYVSKKAEASLSADDLKLLREHANADRNDALRIVGILSNPRRYDPEKFRAFLQTLDDYSRKFDGFSYVQDSADARKLMEQLNKQILLLLAKPGETLEGEQAKASRPTIPPDMD